MRKEDDMKRHLIETTKTLMRRNGHVTIQEITRASFSNIAAVNYHFGTKDKLIEHVVKETLDHLKKTILDEIDALPPGNDIETTMSRIINVIYGFALENVGIVNHIFWHRDADEQASNIFIKTFFETNPFTQLVFGKIAAAIGEEDETVVAAKYTLLFSSLSLPIFMQVVESASRDKHMHSLKNEHFRKVYIRELLKIIR